MNYSAACSSLDLPCIVFVAPAWSCTYQALILSVGQPAPAIFSMFLVHGEFLGSNKGKLKADSFVSARTILHHYNSNIAGCDD